MRYTITKQRIDLIGTIWMPAVLCAQTKDLSDYDMKNLGDPHDRENVEQWLMCHSGDFQHVEDFCADFHVGDEHIVHEWAKGEESECRFTDCMYPEEEEA